MALLPDADRRNVWAAYMRDASRVNSEIGLSKPELRAAVDAVDDWIDANAGAFNSALPIPARTALSARQKAMLLTFVVGRRFEVS